MTEDTDKFGLYKKAKSFKELQKVIKSMNFMITKEKDAYSPELMESYMRQLNFAINKVNNEV